MKDNTSNVIILTIIYLVGRAYNKEEKNNQSGKSWKLQNI